MNKNLLFRLFPVFLILYEFCTNMSNDMYLPALPSIATEFLVPMNWIQLTITAWLAGNTAVQLIVGPLADRYGRRCILFSGGILFLLATLGCAMAPSLAFLIVFRFLQGIGVCTMMISGYASIHDLYDDQKAIHILVWMGSIAIIAPAVGPVFGGLLLLAAGWRVIFLSLLVLGVISLLALWLCMPESTSVHNRESMRIKTLVSSYRRILFNSHFMMSAISFGLLYGGVMGWITTSPFILMNTLGLSSDQFGYLQVPVFGIYILGAQLVKLLMTRMNKEKLIVFGLLVASIAGIAFIISSLLAPSHILSFILPMSIYSLGFGFAAAPLNRTTLTATAEKKGIAMAVFYLVMTGSGTLISLMLSAFSSSVFYSCLVIGVTAAASLILNTLRMRSGLVQ